MNAAARFLNQNVLSRTWVMSVFLSKTQLILLGLSVTIILSALSMIYVTHMTRNLNISTQQLFVERESLHNQWSQLLLEKGTLLMQARVQHIAEERLNMIAPNQYSVVVINE